MSKSQALKALISERLTVAAEEIFGLFERTIAEYEEELCRSLEENQRKQELLDSVLNPLSPRGVLLNTGVQIVSTSCTQTPQIKEEPGENIVKEEGEQLPAPPPESCDVCVKTEESSLLQQRQTEHREETRGEDTNAEPRLHSEIKGEHFSDTDNDEDWSAPFGCSAAQMDIEVDEDYDSQVDRGTSAQILNLSSKYSAAPETSSTVNNVNIARAAEGAERKMHQCSMCEKGFMRKCDLLQHVRVHTGEKPFRCLTCNKTFARRNNLEQHLKTHTGEKPFRCSFCKRTFSRKTNLNTHVRIHTGEKPYRCSLCPQTFAHSISVKLHLQKHAGERPYSCPSCEKTFTQKSNLDAHVRIHTCEKPYSCPICNKEFRQSCQLTQHIKTHKTEHA